MEDSFLAVCYATAIFFREEGAQSVPMERSPSIIENLPFSSVWIRNVGGDFGRASILWENRLETV
jgi:hypothetical protein